MGEAREGRGAREGTFRLVLASASPRRAKLLREAGFEFEIAPTHVSEELSERLPAEEAARVLAERKARAGAEILGSADPTGLVLGSDTVVALGEGETERLLGKPEGPEEAAEMLQALSGSRHRVVTGVSVVRARDGRAFTAHERTWVTMREILPEEVRAYVDSGEWQGKAGGYAIQENADAFVIRLEEGGFDNVVGLPVQLSRELLERALA